jgi:hypothetical protein
MHAGMQDTDFVMLHVIHETNLGRISAAASAAGLRRRILPGFKAWR